MHTAAMHELKENLSALAAMAANGEVVEITKHNKPLIRTPKSADMVHLRTAQWFLANGGLEAFITLDEEQSLAARELGLSVTSF
jgi:antitoxin (DNA-binding transcriptional repressor) of toxin-antitoxin stability system